MIKPKVDYSKLRQQMISKSIEVIVLSSPSCVYYASGFDPFPRPNYLGSPNSTYFVIVRAEDKPVLLAPRIEEPYLDKEGVVGGLDVQYYGQSFVSDEPSPISHTKTTTSEPVEALLEVLSLDREVKTKTVFLELDKIPATIPQSMLKLGVKLENATPIVDGLREIKSEEEISDLRRSIRVNESVLLETIHSIKEGTDTLDLYKVYSEGLVRNQAQIGLCSIGAGNEIGAIPIPRSIPYNLKKGDLVRFDVCSISNGYWSDLARTVVVGKPSENQTRIHASYCQAKEAAIAAIRPGIKANEVFGAARRVLKAEGLPPPELMGHGIGLDLHEGPHIVENSDAVLRENMVLAVEQYYFSSKIGGIQVEDDVLVTAEGSEKLSLADSNLYSAC